MYGLTNKSKSGCGVCAQCTLSITHLSWPSLQRPTTIRYVCMYVCIHIFIHTQTDTHKHTFTYTYIHIYICTYIHVYIYTYIHMYIYTYIHIYIYASLQRRTTTRYVCMYVCMYTHIYTHTHRQTHTHYEVFADIPTTLAAIALNLASMLMRDGVRACGHVGVRVRGCMGFFFRFSESLCGL